jgi:Zn-dependent protease
LTIKVILWYYIIVRFYIFGGVELNYFVTSLSELLARIIVLFTAISVHELAHGYVAYKLGDPTAKYAGRLSLNPMSHLDPFGAICMVLFGFGWAKPVPVNPMYFKDRKRDNALVALAGPLSNVLLAFASTILTALYFSYVYVRIPNFVTEFGYVVLIQLAIVNIRFAVFNLIPFPPLDGSKILGAFLSYENYSKLLMYERFGFPILMLLSFSGILGRILTLFINPIYSLWITMLNGLINILN